MTGEKNRILTECDALFLRTYVSEKHAALQLQDGPRRFGNAVTMNTATCLSVTVAGDIRVSLGCPRVQSSVEDQNECGALVEWCFGGGGMKHSERNLFHFHFIDQKSHMCSSRLVFLIREAGDECGTLVGWYWLGKFEVLEVKTVPLSLWSPQILHRLARDRGLVSAVARLSHDTAFCSSNSSQLCIQTEFLPDKNTIRFHYKYQPMCTEIIAV